MTQEDKELLLKDLSARLPYGVRCKVNYMINNETTSGEDVESECTDIIRRINFDTYSVYTEWLGYESVIEDIKPYLRPMSSMTEEEYIQLVSLDGISITFGLGDKFSVIKPSVFDWLNAHHFDYRGLIEKVLQLKHKKECIT